MKSFMMVIWAVLLTSTFPSNIFAALTIVVQPDKATYLQGELATMSLFAYATTDPGSTAYLQGFELAFDIQPQVGKGYSQTSFTSPSALFGGANGIYNSNTNFLANDASFADFDFRVTADRGTTPDSAANDLNGRNAGNPIKLATVTFNISGTASPGSYNFVFRPGAQLLDSSEVNKITVGGTTDYESVYGGFVASGGSFSVEAVPEPTTITLLGFGLLGGFVCRRFRKRSPPLDSGTAIS
jgi:hypothetical protein